MEDPKMLLNAIQDSQNLSTLLDHLPKEKLWGDYDIYQYEGFWCASLALKAAIAFKSHFEARDDDIILTSSMKTGTTWLKALVSSIMNCCPKENNCDADDDDDDQDPLTTNGPHAVVRTFESDIYRENPAPDLSGIPSPRLFHTHIPYQALPETIKNSNCKLVHIARNPKDIFVSMWHFMNTIRANRTSKDDPLPMDVGFKQFCKGVYHGGPFFDNVLGYWKESLGRPDKILFLKYEEMRNDPRGQVMRLASFLGRPFLRNEEADKVLWRCSLERLKNLEVNKNGMSPWSGIGNSAFLRRGTVGGWKNYFTPEMTEQLDQIMRSKLEGTGLDL